MTKRFSLPNLPNGMPVGILIYTGSPFESSYTLSQIFIASGVDIPLQERFSSRTGLTSKLGQSDVTTENLKAGLLIGCNYKFWT